MTIVPLQRILCFILCQKLGVTWLGISVISGTCKAKIHP